MFGRELGRNYVSASIVTALASPDSVSE